MESRNAALHRLLADAQQGGQAKVDALLALIQRTVFVVPWPNPNDGYRTLVNSSGLAALPVFTEASALQVAAERFGWVGADGRPAIAEIGARQALTFAKERGLAYVIVDIAAEHSLEVTSEEIAPLLTPAARRESQGAFAGVGRISTSLMQSVKGTVPLGSMGAIGGSRSPTPPPGSLQAASPVRPPTPPPGSLPAASPMRPPTPPPGSLPAASPMRAPTPPPGSLPAVRPAVNAPPPGSSPGAVAAPGSSPGAIAAPRKSPSTPGIAAALTGPPSPLLPVQRVMPLASAPDNTQLDLLELALRDFPEVEWACLGLASGVVAVGMHLDPRIRGRLEQIQKEVGRVSNGMPIVLLDDPQLMRAARTEAYMFFPWRKKPSVG